MFSRRCTHQSGVSLVISIPETMDLLQDLVKGNLTNDEVFEKTVDRILLGEDIPRYLEADRNFRVWVFEQLYDITLDAMIYLGIQEN